MHFNAGENRIDVLLAYLCMCALPSKLQGGAYPQIFCIPSENQMLIGLNDSGIEHRILN